MKEEKQKHQQMPCCYFEQQVGDRLGPNGDRREEMEDRRKSLLEILET